MLFLVSLASSAFAEPPQRTTVMTEEFLDRVPTGRDYLEAVGEAPGVLASGVQGCEVQDVERDERVRRWWHAEFGPSWVRFEERRPDACQTWAGERWMEADLEAWNIRSVDQALTWTTRDLSQQPAVFVDGVRVR